jgi:hypothetical protein
MVPPFAVAGSTSIPHTGSFTGKIGTWVEEDRGAVPREPSSTQVQLWDRKNTAGWARCAVRLAFAHLACYSFSTGGWRWD